MNREAIAAAAAELTAAGVDSARVDAELLAAHVLGVARGRLIVADEMTSDQRTTFDTLVARRAGREPLQHIVRSAPFGPIELAVGPGVFTPRPETELILEWAVQRCARIDRPRVADLCSGSGALAIAVAVMVADAAVTAVEIDPDALIWLHRNVSDATDDVSRRLTVLAGDVRDTALLAPASVDLVVSNPPYVPDTADLSPEVMAHDPALAVFAGADGMSVITPMIDLVAWALVPGGFCAIEHDEVTADLVVTGLRGAGVFDEIETHSDLAGRPRFVSGRRICGVPADGVQG